MLSYALAIAVGISSLVLFSTAFLMSKIHRKDDFLWSAVGLFYALVLWYCARNITGAVLLGQAAATVLVVSYSWQTIKLRRAIANPAATAESNSFSVVQSVTGLWKRKKPSAKAVSKSATQSIAKAPKPKVTEKDIAIPDTPAKIVEPSSPQPTKKDQETNISQVKEPAQGFDASPETAEGAKIVPDTNQDIQDSPDNQGAKPEPKQPLPLPNKLPKVAQTDESTSAETEMGEKKAPDQEPAQENIQSAINEKIEPTPKNNPEEQAKPPKPESVLDYLETVEIAEVLEAESNYQSQNRDTDELNIIEVTTSEVNQTDQNPDEESDLKRA